MFVIDTTPHEVYKTVDVPYRLRKGSLVGVNLRLIWRLNESN